MTAAVPAEQVALPLPAPIALPLPAPIVKGTMTGVRLATRRLR